MIDIQVCAFMDCENLKTVVIEEGVKNIGGGAFWRCSALTSIVIPNSVTTLGESSFWGCTAMNTVSIGNGIKEIPRNTFGNCTSLRDFYCYAEDVPTVNQEGFAKTDIQEITLYVPFTSVSAYQTAEPWKNFKAIVALTVQDDYRPFVEDGKVWKVGTITGNPVQVVDHYYFEGDTIIDGKTYKQMMCQRYINPAYPYYDDYAYPNSLRKVGAWYEENKKVYFYDEEQLSMMLKYDFSLGANDTLQFLNVDGYPPFIIGPKQTGGLAGFKGVYRDIMMCVDAGQNIKSTTWLEGVGSIDGPTRNPCNPILGDPVPEFLMSCTVGEEVIYLNNEFEDGTTPEEMETKKHRFDFTHTIKTKPTAPIRTGAEAQSLYGEYNEKQLDINLDPLDDAYLVRITDETGKVVYEKDINAGNIVGLNIDISTYPKGRYVVVVENNYETFTGEFETQTSGVKVIINKKEEKHAIYNLQGQRISTLQKGLNIVNGKKVFVK